MKLFKRLVSLLPSTTITINGKPYLTRYYVFLSDRSWSNIYIHHFHTSDQGDELHNHPWEWGLSLVLAGGYVEERARDPHVWESVPNVISMIDQSQPVEIIKRVVKPGTLNFIRKSDFHRTDLRDEKRGAWTLFFTGPRRSDWGFLNRHTSEFKDYRLNPEAIP
jgi:hypothetical protein